jgi:hypothetical protein
MALRRLDVNAPAAGAQSNELAAAVDGAFEQRAGFVSQEIDLPGERRTNGAVKNRVRLGFCLHIGGPLALRENGASLRMMIWASWRWREFEIGDDAVAVGKQTY